jgi:hypothetical protein
MHTTYNLILRRQGKFNEVNPAWGYQACSTNPQDFSRSNAENGITRVHSSLDLLAKELATFPGSTNAEFLLQTTKGIAIEGENICQTGSISDGEFLEFARSLVRYAIEVNAEKRKGEKRTVYPWP